MKHLRQATQNILKSVEKISDKSILVICDKSLTVLASLTTIDAGIDPQA